ncbi:MAG: hypothetical protein ABW185_22905 [Sedimenticola sp.]
MATACGLQRMVDQCLETLSLYDGFEVYSGLDTTGQCGMRGSIQGNGQSGVTHQPDAHQPPVSRKVSCIQSSSSA